MYAAVATELAQRSERAFRHQRGDASLAKALIAASILLIGWVRSWRPHTSVVDDQCLGRLLNSAACLVERTAESEHARGDVWTQQGAA